MEEFSHEDSSHTDADTTCAPFEVNLPEDSPVRAINLEKDNKFKETQLVLALATTPWGLPLWYEVFPGKTSEGATLNSFVNAWRSAEYPGSTGVEEKILEEAR